MPKPTKSLSEPIGTTLLSAVDGIEDPVNLSGSDDEFKHRLGNNEWLEVKQGGLCACAMVHIRKHCT